MDGVMEGVMEGSFSHFTSLGANPQLTIYGMTIRNATLSNRKA